MRRTNHTVLLQDMWTAAAPDLQQKAAAIEQAVASEQRRSLDSANLIGEPLELYHTTSSYLTVRP